MKGRFVRTSQPLRQGFTIVEAAISVVIVAVMLTAVLQTVGQSSAMQFRVAERTRGHQLARRLMNEIMQQGYVDPAAPASMGPDAGESRPTYNDVDDYNSLDESPPVNKDLSSLSVPLGSTWRRTVSVVWIRPGSLATASPQIETGLKRITVTVYHNGVVVTTLSAIRSNAP